MTSTKGQYESGAFDVRAPEPRTTAVAHLLRQKSRGVELPHPAAAGSGWWERPDKVMYEARGRRTRPASRSVRHAAAPPLLVCGGSGRLGRAILDACAQRNLQVTATDRRRLDICDESSVSALLDKVTPWAIINAAGFSDVEAAEQQCQRAYDENVTGPSVLAAAAHRRGIPFVTFSSDMVFDGRQSVPYAESAATHPINVYGRCQSAAEAEVLRYPRSLCIRSARLFGWPLPSDALSSAMDSLARGEFVEAIDDVIGSPTYVPDLVRATLDLLIDDASGIYHLTNRGDLSWAKLVHRAAMHCGIDATRLRNCSVLDRGLTAPLPGWSVLDSERTGMMPGVDDALERFASWRCKPQLLRLQDRDIRHV